MKSNEEIIDDLKGKKRDLLEEIDTLNKVALANMDMATTQEGEANTHETKANLFLTKLKVLRTDKLFLTSKVETLNKSLSQSQSENVGLSEKIMILSSLDADRKIQ